jgi:twitching motility protein PilT
MDIPDLDRVADELDALHRHATPDRPGDIEAWLSALIEQGGSDLFLVAGAPPGIRVEGEVIAIHAAPLSSEDVEEAVTPMLSQTQWRIFGEVHAVDASFRKGDVRFRVNVHRERGRTAAAIRALPRLVPRLAELGFAHPIDVLSRLPRGLVVICGPTGSGKTTTLAALVGEINRRDRRHIITIEDPIEFEHAHDRSLVEQQELGVDVTDYPNALRAAVRQSPDVIVVGEMRDPATMRLALAAAETGHLVLTTLHATDVAAAVARIVDSFGAEQGAVRQELAMALAAVLVQGLMPRTDGSGRVPYGELLVASYGARQHIRKNALQHLNQEVTITRKQGSFTLEESLARLVQGGVVRREIASMRAAHAEELDRLLNATG